MEKWILIAENGGMDIDTKYVFTSFSISLILYSLSLCAISGYGND